MLKTKKIVIIITMMLFFLLPLINSHLFDLIGIKWGFYVKGNYEFTKVIFFNFFSSIILLLFFTKLLFQKNKQKLNIPKITYFLIGILIISSIFSYQSFTSFLGNSSKSHSSLMFLNLIGLFIVFINTKKEILKKLLFTTIISSIFVSIIGIKEYYFPSFDYGDLGNRALGTFGHPNYLALYILILFPLLFNKNLNIFLKSLLFFLLIITLFLTKSAWGILIFIIYIIYKIISYTLFNLNNKNKSLYLSIIGIIGFFIFGFLIYKFGYITKLHSFLSRFFIWGTTINIIFSDIKNIFFGGGLGTLDLYFDNFKSPYLYIFENIGFNADRPHNLFLNLFYHTGIFGLFFGFYLLYKTIKKYIKSEKKHYPYYESILLFFLFTILNFPSITHYLIIILIGSIIYKHYTPPLLREEIKKTLLIVFFILVSIFGNLFGIRYYYEEYKLYNNKNYKSECYFYNKIKGENYEKNIINKWLLNRKKLCEELIIFTPSVENYFYCGDVLWNIDQKLAKKYYNNGLKILPDLWNENSKYKNQFLIKNFVDKKRFFSKKYSNLSEILKKLNK